jgi:hypothetical protein
MIVNFDGSILAHGTTGRVDEIITAEVRPDLVREARAGWGVENNIYQFGHRGYVAVKGGAQDCPYTYMQDLAAGRYRLPWEDSVRITDGTSLRLSGANAPSSVKPEGGRRMTTIASQPYAWPWNGDLRPDNTALIIIDMQTDFCGPGGYVDKMGYDLSLTRRPIEPIKSVLAAMRAKGYHHHPHPRRPPPRPE